MLTILTALGFILLCILAAFGAAVLWWIGKGGIDGADPSARLFHGIAMLHAWLRHRGKAAAAVIVYDTNRQAVTLAHREVLRRYNGDEVVVYRAFDFNKKDMMEAIQFRPDDGKDGEASN